VISPKRRSHCHYFAFDLLVGFIVARVVRPKFSRVLQLGSNRLTRTTLPIHIRTPSRSQTWFLLWGRNLARKPAQRLESPCTARSPLVSFSFTYRNARCWPRQFSLSFESSDLDHASLELQELESQMPSHLFFFISSPKLPQEKQASFSLHEGEEGRSHCHQVSLGSSRFQLLSACLPSNNYPGSTLDSGSLQWSPEGGSKAPPFSKRNFQIGHCCVKGQYSRVQGFASPA
jgi:hypothetical protein